MHNFIKLITVISCLIFFSTAIAQDNLEQPAPAEQDQTIALPYVAEIIGDKVNIRSGPGTNYYVCGKLNKTDKVKVIAHKYSWSHIIPPKGSFSWISSQYVTFDSDDPTKGIVTGDSVRVYAGSEQLKQIHSEKLQLKLNKGDLVTLIDKPTGDYYKIVPPPGAYLWVSTKYTKPLGAVTEIPVDSVTQLQKQKPTTPVEIETDKLSDFYILQKQIETERAKPWQQQNYSSIKKSLKEIAQSKTAGKASRYAQFTIKQVERFELALEVDKAVKLQDQQLKQTKEKIEKARITKLAQVQDLTVFTVVGIFQTSSVYGMEAGLIHYRIIDDAGKILCYALYTGQAEEIDLNKFIDKKVGLIGDIKPHPQTKSALLTFTQIDEIP